MSPKPSETTYFLFYWPEKGEIKPHSKKKKEEQQQHDKALVIRKNRNYIRKILNTFAVLLLLVPFMKNKLNFGY